MCTQQNAIIEQYFRKRDVNLGQSKAKSYICSVIKPCAQHGGSKTNHSGSETSHSGSQTQHDSSKEQHIVARKHTYHMYLMLYTYNI